MKKAYLAVLLAACLLLSGCSLLERSYSVVEPHNEKYWESDTTLRAENYQDVVNDLLILVGQHAESAVIRLYNYGDDMTVANTLEAAANEVRQETPMGSYAVEYITASAQRLRGFYEIAVSISYRRTAEQVQAVVNATSVEALPELLKAALESDKTNLAVRVGYFQDQYAQVKEIVETLRQERGIPEEEFWSVIYYPSVQTVGMIEFDWSGEYIGESVGAELLEPENPDEEVTEEPGTEEITETEKKVKESA